MPMSKKVFRLKTLATKLQMEVDPLIDSTEKLLKTLKFIGVESFGDSTLIYNYAQTKEALRQIKNKKQELKGLM